MATTTYILQGNYGYGWDDEVEEDTREEIQRRLREYEENGGGQYRIRTQERCDANARKGTGTGVCDRLLDDRGVCDRAADHVES